MTVAFRSPTRTICRVDEDYMKEDVVMGQGVRGRPVSVTRTSASGLGGERIRGDRTGVPTTACPPPTDHQDSGGDRACA